MDMKEIKSVSYEFTETRNTNGTMNIGDCSKLIVEFVDGMVIKYPPSHAVRIQKILEKQRLIRKNARY